MGGLLIMPVTVYSEGSTYEIDEDELYDPFPEDEEETDTDEE